jgi:hypothetical protein
MMRTNARSEKRSGIVLIAVLIVVAVLSLAAYHYSAMMSAEYAAMTSYTNTVQMRALVASGATYALTNLGDPNAMSAVLGNNPYANAAAFQDVLVYQDPTTGRSSFFSIVTLPRPEDLTSGSGQPFRFGVSDENSKLNVNSLLLWDPSGQVGYNMLMQLPNMTSDIANAILDWLDSSSTSPRPGGAKDETYMAMSPPYHCKNGPLDSLEEMLLIQGVTPQLLFGNDRNRNGVLDPGEDDGTGVVDLGWQAYLTVFSTERNIDSTGAPRTYLNDPGTIELYGALSNAFPNNPEVVTYIMAFRLYGPGATITATMVPSGSSGGKSSGGSNSNSSNPNSGGTTLSLSGITFSLTLPNMKVATADDIANTLTPLVAATVLAGAPGKTNISSMWDLVSESVMITVPGGAGKPATQMLMTSPFLDPTKMQTLLPILFDQFTISQNSDLIPRINLTTAPQVVLQMLANATKDPTTPLLTADQVTAITNAQPLFDGPVTPDILYVAIANMVVNSQVNLQTLKALEPYITTRSEVYRFQVVAYTDGPGPMGRAEVVVDTNGGRPRFAYYRELSDMGPGFPLGTYAQQQ